ncbi:hypothetical protein [Streptococcus merionis]
MSSLGKSGFLLHHGYLIAQLEGYFHHYIDSHPNDIQVLNPLPSR